MQDLIASSIKYQQGTLTVLDQYLLPHQQHLHVCNDVETMKDLILTENSWCTVNRLRC